MPQPQRDASQPSLNLDEILFILFRHKWKILLCAALGLAAAIAVYLLHASLYESQAKLLVRYVVDTSVNDPLNSQPKTTSGDSAIESEIEILKSWDLAEQVAEAVGIQRLVPNSNDKPTKAEAARAILEGLTAIPTAGNVIAVSYTNHDPALAVRVLEELLSRYFVKHLEVHRSADAFEFVARQTDQVRSQLAKTEEDLKEIKSKAGITSLAETTATLNSELARNREALQAAETEYAGQQAAYQEMEKLVADRQKNAATVQPERNEAVIKRYRDLLARLSYLRQTELDQLSRYAPKATTLMTASPTADPQQANPLPSPLPKRPSVGGTGFVGVDRENALALARERYRRQNDTGFGYQIGKKDFDTLVKEAEKDILTQKTANIRDQTLSDEQALTVRQLQTANVEKQLGDLEKQFPGLLATGAATPSQSPELALPNDRAALAGMHARVETLRSRIRDLEVRARELSALAPQLSYLERKREVEDVNYKYFQASLEKARIDEALDPSKMPNISAVQQPSPALRTSRQLKKTLLGLAGGGLGLGIALAFFIELVLDRSVKRALELPARLRIPLLLWIPFVPARQRWPLLASRNGHRPGRHIQLPTRTKEVASWDFDHFLRPFAQALRDRITLYFQIRGMNHKPKLVGVTGCSKGAGTSTLAAGLAAALSETGDGKVLLVDMNVGRPEVHPFFRGTPSCSLSEALVGEPAPAGENLYLAVASGADEAKNIIPKRFYDLVPHLKASDFDYIIFDMPLLSQTTITLAMAGYMDKIVLVAESEKSNREVVKRAYVELATVNDNVSAILNKIRFYTPTWLGMEG